MSCFSDTLGRHCPGSDIMLSFLWSSFFFSYSSFTSTRKTYENIIFFLPQLRKNVFIIERTLVIFRYFVANKHANCIGCFTYSQCVNVWMTLVLQWTLPPPPPPHYYHNGNHGCVCCSGDGWASVLPVLSLTTYQMEATVINDLRRHSSGWYLANSPSSAHAGDSWRDKNIKSSDAAQTFISSSVLCWVR